MANDAVERSQQCRGSDLRALDALLTLQAVIAMRCMLQPASCSSGNGQAQAWDAAAWRTTECPHPAGWRQRMVALGQLLHGRA